MYVQLLLSDHDLETDFWCWGGEPIYRDNVYVGSTTTTGYGFTFKKQVIQMGYSYFKYATNFVVALCKLKILN